MNRYIHVYQTTLGSVQSDTLHTGAAYVHTYPTCRWTLHAHTYSHIHQHSLVCGASAAAGAHIRDVSGPPWRLAFLGGVWSEVRVTMHVLWHILVLCVGMVCVWAVCLAGCLYEGLGVLWRGGR